VVNAVGKEVTIGVLALQGAFREHVRMLEKLGVRAVEVRLPEQLEDLDGLIIPGGESTTMGKLMEEYGLTAPLREFMTKRPVFGTCAGLIMLATGTTEGEQPLLATMDVVVCRNAFGRQVHSFEAPVELYLPEDTLEDFPGVFIRAPWVASCGDGVEVIARCEDQVVGVKQDNLLAVAFHPELTGDTRLHEYFVQMVRQSACASCS
jgi:5'-phosphate synthase pdxT subunit